MPVGKESSARYHMDAAVSRLRRSIRAALPDTFMSRLDAMRNERGRQRAAASVLSGQAFPWSSPNVWREIVDFYRQLDGARILEFGMGASTLWHIRELLAGRGGVYTGVENSADWFWIMVAAVLREFHSEIVELALQGATLPGEATLPLGLAIRFQHARVDLRLRPSLPSYLDSLQLPLDVVVVDGIARKECIQHAMAKPPFPREGLLVLMEAGRGSANWWEGHLSEDDDYRAEVELMLAAGGEMVDGDGLDSWPGCPRRSPSPVYYHYPMEACMLQVPFGAQA